MSNEGIQGPDGKEYRRIPCVESNGLKLPVAEIDREVLKNLDPNTVNPVGLVNAALDQFSNQNNILWLGMFNMAKDIKALAKSGKALDQETSWVSSFEEFANTIGLVLTDVEGNRLNVGEELSKI